MSANKLFRLGTHNSVVYLYLCTKSLKSLKMLVYRSASYITSTWKCNIGLVILSKKCSKKIIRSPYFSYILILYIKVTYRATIYLNCIIIYILYFCAYSLNCLKQYSCIPYVRHILYCYCLICHNRCCQNTKCCILSSTYGHFSTKWHSTFDNILFHTSHLNYHLLNYIYHFSFSILL